jgi:hypothetical protein
MKCIRILGLAVLTLLALMAVAASAEEGFVPLAKKGASMAGGKSTINTAANLPIICQKLDPSKVTFTTHEHSTTGTLLFLECTVAGLAANSLGDAAKTILIPVELLVCLINPAALTFGLAAEVVSTLNVEVPSLGAKVTIKGRAIGEVLAKVGVKAKIYSVDFTGAKGVQSVKACVDSGGTKEHTLQAESSLTKKLETASLDIEKGTLTFEEEVELTDK